MISKKCKYCKKKIRLFEPRTRHYRSWYHNDCWLEYLAEKNKKPTKTELLHWAKQHELEKEETLSEKRKAIVKEVHKKRYKTILDEEFIFDGNSLRYYENEFSKLPAKIVIYNGYLARRIKGKRWPELFHRMFMLRKQDKEDIKNIHVHHKNENIKDNRWANFECHHKKKHRAIHKKRRAKQEYSRKFQTFKRKYLQGHPHAEETPWEISRAWNKFREKHGIQKP